MTAAPAMAATFGYELSINDPIFNSANGNLNVPDFQLENISDSGTGIGITDFNLTIGNTRFNYDFVRIQNVTNDPGSDLNFTLNNVFFSNNGIGEDFIDYDFTGFDAGDIFQFEVDVDPDSGSPPQDFRQVLFPTAVVAVTFTNGTTLSQTLNPGSTVPTGYSFQQTESIPMTPVPLPAGLPLYFMALLLGGYVAKRKAIAVRA